VVGTLRAISLVVVSRFNFRPSSFTCASSRARQPWTVVLPCSTLSRAKNCRYIAAFIRSAGSGGCRPSPRRPIAVKARSLSGPRAATSEARRRSIDRRRAYVRGSLWRTRTATYRPVPVTLRRRRIWRFPASTDLNGWCM